MVNAKKSNYKKRVFKKGKSIKKVNKVSIKKAVEGVLYKKVEPKQCGNDPAIYAWNALNSTMSPAVDLGACFGNLIQGTADGQRIGNRIDVTKAVLNLNCCIGTSPYPQIITIFIGYMKGQRSVAPGASSLNRIFNDGNTSTGMTGITLDLLRTLNTDLFTVKRYDFKIGFAEQNLAVFPSNNDFPCYVNKKISLAPLIGNLIFTADSSTTYNKNLYMFCQYTNIFSSPSTLPPVLNWYVDGLYKDM